MTIYSKTAKGMREASGKTKKLSKELRALLKLVNGKATHEELRGLLNDADRDALEPCILSLVEEGYIHELEDSNEILSSPLPPRKAPQKVAPAKPAIAAEDDESGGDLDFFTIPAVSPPPASVLSPNQPKSVAPTAVGKVAMAKSEGIAPQEAMHKSPVVADEMLKQLALVERRVAAETQARRDTDEQVQHDSKERLRRKTDESEKLAAAESKRRELEEKTKRAAEAEAKRAADESKRREGEENAMRSAQAKVDEELRITVAREQQERQRAAADALAAKSHQEAEEKLRREAEEKLRREAEEKLRREAEEKLRREAEEKLRHEAEEKLRREAEEIVRREVEEREKREAAERLRNEAGERAKKMFEEKKRREAEEKLKQEAREAAQREEVERLRIETERLRAEVERQRIEAAAKAEFEAQEQARIAAEVRIRREAAERVKADEAERERLAAAAKEAQFAQDRLRRDAEEKIEREIAERGRLEAEAAARVEAERIAQRETEANAVRDAADRLQREADEKRRIEAEVLAKRDAEEKIRQAAAEKVRTDAEVAERLAAAERQRVASEQQARVEAEAQERRDAEAQAQRDVDETKWRAEELARRESEAQLEREQRQREESERAEQKAVAPRRYGKPRNWGKPISIALMFLTVVGFGLIHVLPFDGQKLIFEQTASALLKQPVKIKSLHFAMVPQVHWRADDVNIGDGGQIHVDSIKGGTSVGALIGKSGEISSLELDTVTVSEEGLRWLLFGKPQQGGVVLPTVKATNVKLMSTRLLLPVIDLSAEFGSDWHWKKLVAQSADRKFLAEFERGVDDVKLTLRSASYAPPSAFSLEAVSKSQNTSLTDFSAIATISERQLTVSEFSGGAFDGVIAGSARMSWDDGILLTADLRAKRLGIATMLPSLFEFGVLNGNGSFVMTGKDSIAQRQSVRGEGNFVIEQGELRRVDLGKALQGGSSSGRTAFSAMNGRFVFSDGKTQINGIKLIADLLTATGNAQVSAENALGGQFVIDLRSAKIAVKGSLVVTGSLTEPKFIH